MSQEVNEIRILRHHDGVRVPGRRKIIGCNQAMHIPRDLELPGREVLLRREGRRLILEPIAKPSLLGVLAMLKSLDEDFPRIEKLRGEPVDL